MRLCDEYSERFGLAPLRLRHCSKFFLFFGPDNNLLSCKWIQNGSSGYYEFCECFLGKSLKVLKREKVEWDLYETFLENWIESHEEEIVFDKTKVFNLVWEYFVASNDRLFSLSYDPVLVYETLSGDEKARMVCAMDLVGDILESNPQLARFWNGKAMEIISRYAHWINIDQKKSLAVE